MLKNKKQKSSDKPFGESGSDIKIGAPKEDKDDLRGLIEKNIKWSQLIFEQNKKIKKRLTLMAVGSYLRLALIIIPIILGIIYLPAFLSDVWQDYASVIGVSPESLLNTSPIDKGAIEALIDQFYGEQDIHSFIDKLKQ